MSRRPPSQRTRIKICGLTREQDVDAAVEAGADAVGFVLYPKSPRFVTAAARGDARRRLPPFVTPVLLFVNEAQRPAMACAAAGARRDAAVPRRRDARSSAWKPAAGTYRGCAPRAFPLGRGRGGLRLGKIRFHFEPRPGHPARRPRRRLRRRRQGIRLVTSSSKRQRSPRLVWWVHTCKRGRWHRAGAAALQTLAVDVSSGVEASKGIKDAGQDPSVRRGRACRRRASCKVQPHALLPAT
jgi:phosphoribosylanthranilate isomerase